MSAERDNICPYNRPRFGMVRLCEGRSIMLTPRCSVLIDLFTAEKAFAVVSKLENEFVKVEWKNVLVTLYRKGSMLFYRLSDKDAAERYAAEILTELGLIASGGCCGSRKVLAAGDDDDG